jgi:putative transposase
MTARTVSIWTTAGRLSGIRFGCCDQQHATLAAHRRGGSDLVCRNGKWFLYVTCDIPDVVTKEPDGFLGVDLGIANIATTSDGGRYCGKGLNQVRHRHQRLRAKLQSVGTKSAKRLLKARRRKEARFAADTNHRIAKSIVTEAERTGRGIALEDLGGIRDRVRLRRPSGSRCTRGRSTNSASSSPTRRPGPQWPSSMSTRRIPRKAAPPAGTSPRPTGPTNPPSDAHRAVSLNTPM